MDGQCVSENASAKQCAVREHTAWTRFVRDHSEECVNKRNAGVIRKNMASDFCDHDGPGGKPAGVDGDEQMMLGMYKAMLDLHLTTTGSIAPLRLLILTFALSAGHAFETATWRAVVVSKEHLGGLSAQRDRIQLGARDQRAQPINSSAPGAVPMQPLPRW
jgi:hypothetical protein